jgi:hypothetical protein
MKRVPSGEPNAPTTALTEQVFALDSMTIRLEAVQAPVHRRKGILQSALGAQPCFLFSMKYCMKSIGTGKRIVEFFSAAISVSVWRYRS